MAFGFDICLPACLTFDTPVPSIMGLLGEWNWWPVHMPEPIYDVAEDHGAVRDPNFAKTTAIQEPIAEEIWRQVKQIIRETSRWLHEN